MKVKPRQALRALAFALALGAVPASAAEFPMVSLPPWDSGQPAIRFTHVPDYGVWGEPLRGEVQLQGGRPQDFKVCLFIKVAGGWWSKPSYALPSVPISPDSTFSAIFTTGGSDEKATHIIAYLTPQNYSPPIAGGDANLPADLDAKGFPKVIADRSGAVGALTFAGYRWSVKDYYWGPGPNFFSDSPQNVWVDERGQLHLRITRRGDRWYCAEVVSQNTFGRGRYVWTLASPVDQLNENVVLGLFTYDPSAPEADYRELDIEFSRWGNRASATNAQYVVQPFGLPGRRHQFSITLPEESTHLLDWGGAGVRGESRRGGYSTRPASSDILHQWSFPPPDVQPRPAVPAPGFANARMNLWLLDGKAPSDAAEVEVVIKAFTFIPVAATAPSRIAVLSRALSGQDAQWILREADGSRSALGFGGPGDQPVPADYLGAGTAQAAVFRPGTGQWFIRMEEGRTTVFQLGGPGDLPVPAPYAGSGHSQLAVFHPAAPGRDAEWLLRNDDGSTTRVAFGGPGDVPVPADYLGLGRASLAVFRPATGEWFLRRDSGATDRIAWGTLGDQPVPGDYLGLGHAQIAVFRPTTGEWLIRDDQGQATVIVWGARGDRPVPGDYSGAGRTQLAVYRPATGEWILRGERGEATAIVWGSSGDEPVPAAFGSRFGPPAAESP